ncbi:MAG: Asp-tRNA(Asn)/Glu-tRNA(Gln) amidotransferase subunit GatA [Candidatus Doudnabacteria bacterium]|nr:Asp-tRNA(Asn)/Glu-tRNA(Gln) amidotransferase subunit GatA [Candidatus Doudnabacteria bacterium]
MDLTELTITQAAQGLLRKQFSAVELAKAHLERIKSLEPKLHAFLHVAEQNALADAATADDLIAQGKNFPLTGIPYAVKDNILVSGMPATAASKILQNFVAPYDATIIRRLRQLGTIVLGKTNLDEFALGSSTENSAFGPTFNPYDTTRVPGGSSGGSAASVAAFEAVFALGTDTGGSIRQPAAFCGVVGLKPTQGRVSRYGLVAIGSSLDQAGVLSKTVEDAFLVLQQIAGMDEFSSTTLSKEVPDYSKFMDKGVKGFKIGLPKEYFAEGVEPEVKGLVESSAKKLQEQGAVLEEMSLSNASLPLAVYHLILPVEISSNLSRYDGIRYGLSVPSESLSEVYYQTRSAGFGPEAKRRIMIGTYASSAGYFDAYYKKAKQVQALIKQEFVEAFARYDLLLTPTTPTAAFKVGERAADPLAMYLADILTVASNISGVPAISIPAGLTKAGLPVGVQLIAPHFKEETLLQAGHALEQSLGLKLKPNLQL